MAQERLYMRKIKEVLILKWGYNPSNRAIGRRYKVIRVDRRFSTSDARIKLKGLYPMIHA